MRLFTCAVCGKENYIGFELCKDCWQEWTISGTYSEETATGTFSKPEWMRFLIATEYKFQTNYAAIKEDPFADMSPEFQLRVGYEIPDVLDE